MRGCCGNHFFSIPWSGLTGAVEETIARKELLACVIALFCFGDVVEGKHVKLHTDNENALHWLLKGRSSSVTGTKYLALWEGCKYKRECKSHSGCPIKGKDARMAQTTRIETTTIIESEKALQIEPHGHMAKNSQWCKFV